MYNELTQKFGLKNQSVKKYQVSQFVAIRPRSVLQVLTDTNPKAFEVGELFIMETMNTDRSDLVIAVLTYWMNLHSEVRRQFKRSDRDVFTKLREMCISWFSASEVVSS